MFALQQPEANRAVALLRVSTKQQTSKNEKNEIDIPEQKAIIEDFIWENKLDLVRTLVEGGVSGYKNLASERDAVQIALDMAKRREYDMLVIYHSNRLGRLADDTPRLVKQFNNYGIKVISVREGEISVKTHMDKAMTFFRYWNNEQESIYKSEIISDYHLKMVEEGRFRGGNMIPFGYKLIDNNNKNAKGRRILDFVIDEKEAEVVKLIYDLSINKGYGQARTAKYLNEKGYKTKKGNSWHSTSIQVILSNPIYKGQFRMRSKIRKKEVLSPIIEDLVIIPTDLWDLNRKVVEQRKYTTDKKHDFIFKDKRINNSHGKYLLLNGIAYCGSCGMRLSTMTAYKRWTTKDNVKHKEAYHKYRCSSFYKRGSVKCEGQSTYGATKIEPIVIKETKNFILELQSKNLKESFLENIRKEIEELNKNKKSTQNNLADCYKQLKSLKAEVVKIISGENSNFSQKLINELITDKENEIKEKEIELKKVEDNILNLKSEKTEYSNLNYELINWDEKFDKADLEEKRLMLSKVLEKVVVYPDTIQLQYNVRIETYKNNCEDVSCQNTDIVRANCAVWQSIIQEIRMVSLKNIA